MPEHRGRFIAATLVIMIVLLVFPAAMPRITAQESASYRMERVTIAASAARATSPSYDLSLTFGEEGPAGSISRCNDGFLQTTGFWSVLGEAPVPILLEVRQTSGSPEDVDLTWSGASDLFDVYRSELRDSVKIAPNLTATIPECSISDSPPVIPGILYYLVVPAGS